MIENDNMFEVHKDEIEGRKQPKPVGLWIAKSHVC